jgi:tRNA pseudouridine55 synthase
LNRRARGDGGLDGFLIVHKPVGPTSHDIVALVRRVLKTRRVGHAGTLDPLAEGVLPIALGRATRLLQELTDADKEYQAEILLGRTTTTDDAEGEVTAQKSLPPLDVPELAAVLERFRGTIMQVPPAFSAVKVAGRRAYELARAGEAATVASRPVTISEIEILSWEQPLLCIRVRCSKGTYIRSLARDVGEAIGTGASLQALVRTRVGSFDRSSAITLEQLTDNPSRAVLSADTVSLDRPAVVLGEDDANHLLHGRRFSGAPQQDLLARAYGTEGQYLGLLAARNGQWQPKLVLSD